MKDFFKKTLPIYLTNSVTYFYYFPLALLALIYAWFPDIPETTIMLITTVPALVSIFASLSMSAVLAKIDKKLLMVIGLALNLISGAAIYFSQGSSFYLVIGCSALSGIGYGIISSTTNAALAEITPQDKLAKTLGINSACGSFGLVVLNLLAGNLASDGNWVRAYLSSFLMLPILIYVFVAAPKMKPQAAVSGGEGTITAKATKKEMFLLAAITGVFVLAFTVPNTFSLNYSSYIIDQFHLGTSVETGIVGTFNCAGEAFGGFILAGIMDKIFKDKAPIISIICTSAAVASTALITNSVFLVDIVAFLSGTFSFVTYSCFMAIAAKTIPQVGTTMSIFVAATGATTFLTPYISEFLTNLFGGAFITRLWIAAGTGIVAMVLLIPIIAAINKNAEEREKAAPAAAE